MTDFETEIRKTGYIVYTNVGNSMMPLLRQRRDLMVIRAVTAPLKKNDVVLFKRPSGAYVLHRIIRVCRGDRYRIAGDNRHFSEIVPRAWIIGILTEIRRDGETVSVDSPEYRAYVRRVPWHRLRLKWRRGVSIVRHKLKKMTGRLQE